MYSAMMNLARFSIEFMLMLPTKTAGQWWYGKTGMICDEVLVQNIELALFGLRDL